MTIKDIFERERENRTKIYLYKEGIFFKAYEQSAFAFATQRRDYMPKAKMVKSINQKIVSLGFPQSALNKYLDRVVKREEKTVVLECDPIDVDRFQEWKQKIPFEIEKPQPTESIQSENSQMKRIFERIRTFPIETKSPMECMLFVSEIKKELSNGDVQ